MKLSLFDYHLPKESIAQSPADPRDSSRLLIYDRKKKIVKHEIFKNIVNYLTPNDVLVFNNSKVFPARIIGKKSTGGKAELLLLKEKESGIWECLVGARNPLPNVQLVFDNKLEAQLIEPTNNKSWLVKFNKTGEDLFAVLEKIGEMPLPPYIHSTEKQSKLKKQYQTVYAKQIGSAAAPTAGLHFTDALLKKIKKTGCQLEFITLHVGLGTFNSVDTENIEDYKIHSEAVFVSRAVLNNLWAAKQNGKRIIAVGTTSVRTLEAIFKNKPDLENNFEQSVSIFIYPPCKLKFVDAMITNFHLPKSSLLMLVSAFAGRKKVLELYKLAIAMKYRFFSFGDAMMLK